MHASVNRRRRLLAACAAVTAAVCVAACADSTDAAQSPAGSTGAGVGNVSLSVQDRLDIQYLFARYSQDLDMGTDSVLGPNDLVDNVFAPDGVFHDPSLCLVGREELKAGLVSHPSHAKTSQHWPMNVVFVEGAGNHARTHTYVIVFSGRGASPAMYHDTLVKLNGKWLIQKREVVRRGAIKRDPRCPTDLETLEPGVFPAQ